MTRRPLSAAGRARSALHTVSRAQRSIASPAGNELPAAQATSRRRRLRHAAVATWFLCAALYGLTAAVYTPVRTEWVHLRSTGFWDTTVPVRRDSLGTQLQPSAAPEPAPPVRQAWTPQHWVEHVRMSQATFNYVVDAVLPLILRQETRLRAPLRPDFRVFLGLYQLLHRATTRHVENLCGVGRATAHGAKVEVVHAVVAVLYARHVRFPSTESQLTECLSGFTEMGFPQAVGAVDGTHIPVQGRYLGAAAAAFFNYKQFHSVLCVVRLAMRALLARVGSSGLCTRPTAQMVADAKCRFIYGTYGWPGCANDMRAWGACALYKALRERRCWSTMAMYIGSTLVPLLLLGDSGFTQLPWVATPYAERVVGSDPTKRAYNDKHKGCRRVVEQAYGLLKGRFRSLECLDCVQDMFVPHIQACVALHNMLIDRREEEYGVRASRAGDDDSDDASSQQQQPQPQPHGTLPAQGELVRAALAEHFASMR